jgi:asparagine synthase (glutamine-hydrolysing)
VALTEVLITLRGIRHGADLSLLGMFAVVLWGLQKQAYVRRAGHFRLQAVLLLPLRTARGWVFGSEIKAYLEHPKFVKAVNDNALRPI